VVAYAISGQKLLVDEADARLREMRMAPGEEVPLHLHGEASDIIYCLEGAVGVEADGETARLLPGEARLIRPGVAHRVRNMGQEPARYLLFQWGGAYDFISVEAGGDS
jgi:quercetin dioxygenase-like cupin family protein